MSVLLGRFLFLSKKQAMVLCAIVRENYKTDGLFSFVQFEFAVCCKMIIDLSGWQNNAAGYWRKVRMVIFVIY